MLHHPNRRSDEAPMAFTLHSATIPSYLQILGSLSRLVGKAETHCAENGLEPGELIQARLAPDMLPFAYQVKSATVHSAGAIEGVRRGLFAPDTGPSPDTFAGLKDRVLTVDPELAGAFEHHDDLLEAVGMHVCGRTDARLVP